jgi:hypothetical protein
MQRLELSHYSDPLDLLRRFIQTPMKATYRIEGARVGVETNDFTLLPELPLDLGLTGPCALEWKLIRDADSPGLLATPMFLTSATLTVVAMGTACLLGLDHETHKLFGFIGRDIDALTFQKYLVPFLCRMTKDVLSGDPIGCFVSWSHNSAHV